MGLLDEAIREHLELKRRRGADPGEVAREEREALAPVFAEDGEEPVAVEDGLDEAAYELSEDAPVADVLEPEPAAPSEDRLAHVGQETAELDMQAAMDEDPDAADSGAPVGPIPPEVAEMSSASAQESIEEALDWGFHADAADDEPPQDASGQERMPLE